MSVDFTAEAWTSPADWARMYRSLGLQVVPAHSPAAGQQWKRPKVDWVEFQNALAVDGVFARWYGQGGSDAGRPNMGLICGAASGGLLVVDLDLYKEKLAASWWGGLMAVHNNAMPLDTWVQRTGGGGLQFFFRAPEGWTPPTFKAPSAGVDVRGQGGFVMCPPSMHESGQPYEWEPGYEPWQNALLEAPDWLCEAVEALRLEHGGQPVGEARQHVAPEGVKNGFGLDTDGREDKMLRAVFGAVVDLRRDSPIPPSQAVQETEVARLWGNYERTTKTRLAGLPNAEGLEREGRGLSELRKKWSYAMGQWDAKVREAAGQPRPIEPAAEPESAGQVAAPAAGELPSPAVIDVGEWHGEPPERRWIVPEWIVEGAVNSLYGDGGLGKTLLAQQLAYSVALGADWLGLPTARGGVLGVFCEDDEGELKRRHAAIKASLGHPIGNPFRGAGLHLWPRVGAENTLVRFNREGAPQLTPFHAELAERVADTDPSLLILDTLADVYGGNELDRPQVNYFAKSVLGGLIRAQAGRGRALTVLLLGHPSVSGAAGGGRGYSGSTAWNNSVRARFYLTRPEDADGDTRVLTRGKANYAKSGDETAIRLTYGKGILEPQDSSAVSHGLEHSIRLHIDQSWREGRPFLLQGKSDPRYIYKALPEVMAGVGYDPKAARLAIEAMIREGVIRSRKRGDHSGADMVE